MGSEIFLYLFIVCCIIFVALFIYLLRDTIKKRREVLREAIEEVQKQDLCDSCVHCWEDSSDCYFTHCEVLENKVGSINRNLNEVVLYPCTQCPFDAYLQKKE